MPQCSLLQGILGVVVQSSGCDKLRSQGALRGPAMYHVPFPKFSRPCQSLFPRSSRFSDNVLASGTAAERRPKEGPRSRRPRRPESHFRRRFTSWLGGWSRAGARARGRGGGSVSAGRSGHQLAGGRAPIAGPALAAAAAPPPLRVAGRPGGRDNVAELGVAGRRQLRRRLKWVLPGCCLARRPGDREEGEAAPGCWAGSARGGFQPLLFFSKPRAQG